MLRIYARVCYVVVHTCIFLSIVVCFVQRSIVSHDFVADPRLLIFCYFFAIFFDRISPYHAVSPFPGEIEKARKIGLFQAFSLAAELGFEPRQYESES